MVLTPWLDPGGCHGEGVQLGYHAEEERKGGAWG